MAARLNLAPIAVSNNGGEGWVGLMEIGPDRPVLFSCGSRRAEPVHRSQRRGQFASERTLLAADDNGGPLDPGSSNDLDSLLSYTFQNTGRYYIRVTSFEAVNNLPYSEEATFLLHVSLSDTVLPGSQLDGGAGNDLLVSGRADDSLDGNIGTDIASFANATIGIDANLSTGRASGDGIDRLLRIENLTGSRFNDILTGDARPNELIGAAGNDILNGGGGADTASYAATAGAVAVSLAIATAQNTGAAGIDTLTLIENLTGSSGNDTLTGSNVANILIGGSGNDLLSGGLGIDTASYATATSAVTVSLAILSGQNTIGAGTDTLTAFENLTGSAFNDRLTGNAAANILSGGAGNDTLVGGAGLDTASYITATAGLTVSLATTLAQATGGASTDTLTEIENLTGSNFNDLLIGGAGNNVINGSSGIDTVSYAAATAAVTVSLATTAAQNSLGAGTDRITAVENLTGSGFADSLSGNAKANSIDGGGGNDTITGGGGIDSLRGGTGFDRFVLADAPGAATRDVIGDFSVTDDSIALDQSFFAAIGPVGNLAPSAFRAGTAPLAAADRIVFDSVSGRIFYDADGSGVELAIEIALVTPGLALTFADFAVIA